MYKNGTIALLAYKKPDKPPKGIAAKFFDLVLKVITLVTKSRYFHIYIYLEGYWYESTHPNGAKKSELDLKTSKYLQLREPKFDYTKEQVSDMIAFGENAIANKIGYNYVKLLMMSWIYPMRRFFNWLGWTPFSCNAIWGMVCSVFVDELVKFGGTDLFKKQSEELTSPREFEILKSYRDIA